MSEVAEGVAITRDAVALGLEQRIQSARHPRELARITFAEAHGPAGLDLSDLLLEPSHRRERAPHHPGHRRQQRKGERAEPQRHLAAKSIQLLHLRRGADGHREYELLDGHLSAAAILPLQPLT